MEDLTDDYRRTISLNGPWEFATDDSADGRDNDWYQPTADWPSHAETVTVPHAWQESDDHREYTGTAWYRRTVSLEAPPDRAVHLRFGAVDYETTVWVNGERVGTNRGGYLPFTIDVTDALLVGENAIVIEVIDPEDSSEIPHGKQGAPWYQRISGIWQDVTLEILPPTRVETIRATPDLREDAATIDLAMNVPDSENAEALTATVAVSVDGDPVTAVETGVNGEGTASVTIPIEDPSYWTPDTPTLYDVVVTLEREGRIVDRYEDYFGMRSIEARDGQLYLNGEPYFMRGALDQGYYPETLYRPFEPSLFEEEIRTAKELGFNLLRKHIKPAHPDFLEAADRLGILVWEEPANPTIHTERSKREVRDQILGLLERDYNRPSVIVWSLYNEEWGIGNPQGLDEETSLWDDPDKQAYLADLYEEVKSLDETRLVCDNSGWAHVATDLNDYHRYFVSPDRAAAWADDLESITESPADNYGATETDPETAPLIVSEFGTWGMCDLPAIEDYYGETPPWFDYDFFDGGIKRPEGVYDRYAETTLPDAFEDWTAFADAWQWREFRSIKDVIERMRAHEGVAGYVITELSDIEWEFNGILDYRRERKAFHDAFARVNGEVAVMVEPTSHAVRTGDTLTADVIVSNHTTDPIEADVEWSAFGESGTLSIDLEGYGVARLDNAISVDIPTVDSLTTRELTATLGETNTTTESITVAPEPGFDSDLTLFVDDEVLAARLEERGLSVERRLDSVEMGSGDRSGGDDADDVGGPEEFEALERDVDVAIVTDPESTPDLEVYVENGGTVVRLPNAEGRMSDDPFFAYRELPETESWNLVASLFYRDADPLGGHLETVPGWELESTYPYHVVADVGDEDRVHVGYLEGWVANWGAAATVRDHGDGQIGAFTFRVTTQPNPVAIESLITFVESIASHD